MMAFFRSLPRPVQMLSALGFLSLLLLILLSMPFVANRLDQAQAPNIPQGMLGQEGVACGGPERLPCEPEFVCDTEDDETYGTCVPDLRTRYPLGAEGVVCNTERGCLPGLTCNAIGGAAGVCVKP